MRLANEIKVSLVTAVCILALVIIPVFLNLQLDFIAQYAPVWIFFGYIVITASTLKAAKYITKTRANKIALFWSLLIIFVTLLVLIFSAI